MSPRGDTPKPKPKPKRPQRPTRVAREENPRKLTDARTMRAIAHPVRVALLEALTREGPLTATEASELIGESPANCSFHLRTLAKYGFVEEAEGGTGRNRPWQRVALGMSFETVHDDTEMSIAATVLADGLNEHVFELSRRWAATRGEYPAEWQKAAFTDHSIVYLTPDELRSVENELFEVCQPYRHRTLDRSERPADARPVSLVVLGHPLPPSPSGN